MTPIRFAPATAALAVLLLTGPGVTADPPAHKAPLPTVLLIPASSGDVAALVDLRTRLRLGGHVSVLTYDPESAAIQRAAADDAHPEWLTNAPVTDAGRMQLARALDASFYAVVSPGRIADTTHVELVETAPAARTFDWTGTNREFGVHALESQVADSVSHPANYDAVASNVTPPAAPSSAAAAGPSTAPVASILTRQVPIAAVPVPGTAASIAAAPTVPVSIAAASAVPVTIAAVPIAAPAAPVAVASVPVLASPAPIKIVVPSAVTVKPPAPLPVKSAPVPVERPTQVASDITIPPLAPFIVMPVLPQPLPAPEVPVMTAVPLPKTVRAVPAPQLMTAVPAPRLEPVPLPALVLPKMIAIPQQAPVVPPAPNNGGARTDPEPASATSPLAPPLLGAGGTPQSVLPVKAAPEAVKVAALPKREIPAPALPLPFVPQPAAVQPVVRPVPTAVKKSPRKTEDMSAIEPLLAKGDSALGEGDAVSAIALYREAVNGAPLSVTPRLKLAEAYQKDGLNDRALDEARRALEIAPDSVPVQQFLADLDQQTGTSAGTLVRYRAALERDPSSPNAHAALADALWNNGDLGGAEAEYKAASALAPEGSHLGTAQLAQLYAAEARYGDCLAMLQTGGSGSYATAIQIVKNRTDTLSSTLAASRTTFAAHQSTREQFYDDAKKLSAQAQALAGFVAQITPPSQYKLSHLHRMLSTNLLAQETATLVSYIETGDSRQNDSISQLERATATEMLTAQATEEKLGLWKKQPHDN